MPEIRLSENDVTEKKQLQLLLMGVSCKVY
jgi:hypothetical protein